MILEEMKHIAKRFAVDAWSGDVAVFDEVCSPDYKLGDYGLEQLKQIVHVYHHAMPDFQVTIGEMIAEGDALAYRFTMTGTHLGDFMGKAPTGKPFNATGITILHFRDGKIIRDEFESGSKSFDEQIS